MATDDQGLRHLVQKRLLTDVFQSASDKAAGWKILVVDETSMQVISSAVGMYDIMEKKITIVESLEKKRAPFTDKGVIYLMEPSEKSVNLLLADYADRKKILYGPNVFLYFLSRLPDELLDKIKQCRPLLKRIKALAEINLHFLAKEERTFSLNMRASFNDIYMRTNASAVEEQIADKLVTVCATLNEYPHIRFKEASVVCKSLANLFHSKMDDYVASNPSWWYHGGGKDAQGSRRDRSTLLLLDRADDCLTPLMHELTYQSIVHDLMPMQGNKLTYYEETGETSGEKEQKDVLLDDKDAVWVEMRDKHVAYVVQTLISRLNEVLNSKTGSSLRKKGDNEKVSIAELQATLKAAPEFREVTSKLSQHIEISSQCMNTFTSEGLVDLSEIEQTLATGTDDEGHTPKMTEIIDRVELALRKTNDIKARLRLLLIATISQNGLSRSDRSRLTDAADFSKSDVQTINNLDVMGVPIVSNSADRSSLRTALFGGGAKSSRIDDDDDDEDGFQQSRYKPVLKDILSSLLGTGEPLSFEQYPSVLPMPEATHSSGTAASARRKKKGAQGSARKKTQENSRWAQSVTTGSKGGRSKHAQFTGARTLLFMVGGMSYTELKVVRQFMDRESSEIICGSTAFVSAKEFIDDLSSLSNDM